MTLSYLVSTAGHAQAQNELDPHNIETILQLVQEGSKEFQDEKVVGFTSLTAEQEWTCETYSYPELLGLSFQLAVRLEEAGLKVPEGGGTVCLLCPTGLDFLVVWIAFMRLGLGTVFVAPQCSPAAINNLYKTTSSLKLVYHSKYRGLANQTSELDPKIDLLQLPASSFTRTDVASGSSAHTIDRAISPSSVSHVFHSSGTSGFPKPIPNTHSRSISVLPRRPLPSYIHELGPSTPMSPLHDIESAAFTTTPLFHGGVSDLLRAWMARSMIYFYPTSDVPVTTTHVVQAVKVCRAPGLLKGIDHPREGLAEERAKRFRVSAFLSVPYILSTLAEDLNGEGMQMLREMELVSTGGAPLETAIGDAMVGRGVKLVSRLGSSECGFLLSSHRDYETEKDWELLRNDSPYSGALLFEEVGETARFEMVVTAKWSSLTKSNRDDGSYSSGDLYEKHPTKPDVWRYVGRGDDVIVMSNGEKASPGPIESTLRASPDLSDALVVGSDRAELGLLLFPKTFGQNTKDLLDRLSQLLAEANRASPSFAQIGLDMCLVIDNFERATALPKSSKGTVQRVSAYDTYRAEIDSLYGQTTQEGNAQPARRGIDGVKQCVRDSIVSVISGQRKSQEALELNTDLFAWGVDSLMASRIRVALQKALNVGSKPLPRNIVFEQPSIERLSSYIYNRQEGLEDIGDTKQEAIGLMHTLAARYGTFDANSSSSTSLSSEQARSEDILLTGGTGALGSHLIHRLSLMRPKAKIICLVRAETDEAARIRLLDVLAGRALSVEPDRLEVLSANVAKPHLGLSPETYARVAQLVGTVIHAAWPVHFASSLVSFEDQIQGTRNLIDLVRGSPHSSSHFYFCSSIASVTGISGASGEILEEPSIDPLTASPIGYSQSKWVVERICQAATETSDMSGRVHVLRIGQLCGDTKTGYWNEKEGWPLLIRTGQTTSCLPSLEETPSWLPVDIAAQTIVDIVETQAPRLIYHVLHPLMVRWETVLSGVKEAGVTFDTVDAKQWLDRVDASIEANDQDPSAGVISMWRDAYGSMASDRVSAQPTISTAGARDVSNTLRDAPPIESPFVANMVLAWRKSGFFR